MKTKIFIRVNVAKNKGLGHWVRCTALASMLRTEFDCVFLIKTEHPTIVKQTRTKGFSCHQLPNTLALMEEPEYLKLNFLTGNEIIVLDSYDFTTTYQKALQKIAGKIVSIDDIHATHFVSDVVINHSGGIDAAAYQTAPQTQLFLGLDYLLLREEFFNPTLKNNSTGNAFEKLLICLGGEDPQNDTLQLLKNCAQFSAIKTCEVIVGSGYRFMSSLEDFCLHAPLRVNISKNLSALEMSQKMQTCTAAICSPSTVALEYLSIGGPMFLYQTASNQQNLKQYLLKTGLAFPFASMTKVSAESLRKAVEKQSDLIDGKSPERLRSIFNQLQRSLDCTFRLAQPADVHQYFHWTNDPTTRQQSFNSAPIPFNQHSTWFQDQLLKSSSFQLVMEYQEKPIGQIRFNLKGSKATISYSLCKNVRGKGFAKWLVAGGIAFLQKEKPQLLTIEGFVKQSNVPSKKVFKRLGFKEVKAKNSQASIKYIQQLKQAS